jgi:hypothetical protein
VIDSDFSRSDEKWKAFEDERLQPVKYDVINKYIGIQSDPDPNAVIPYGAAFFLAPEEYLGDMRASYNQDIMFKLRVNDEGPTPGAEDVIIVGGGAKTTKISLSITEQNNSVPAFEV